LFELALSDGSKPIALTNAGIQLRLSELAGSLDFDTSRDQGRLLVGDRLEVGTLLLSFFLLNEGVCELGGQLFASRCNQNLGPDGRLTEMQWRRFIGTYLTTVTLPPDSFVSNLSLQEHLSSLPICRRNPILRRLEELDDTLYRFDSPPIFRS
jgi:hypothetical protein